MLNRTIKNISLLTFIVLGSLVFGTHKVHAATINVVSGTDAINNNGQCQLSEAIQNINDQAVTNSDCLAGDGSNDTINLPSGTVTLTNNLPGISQSIIINGTGRTTSIVNGAGHAGFSANFNVNQITKDVTIQNMKLTSFSNKAISIFWARTATLTGLDIDNCNEGASIDESKTVNVSNSIVRNNVSTELVNPAWAGLQLSLAGLISSDKPTMDVRNVQIINNTSAGQIGRAGLDITTRDSTVQDSNQFITSESIVVHNATIKDNISGFEAGLMVTPYNGPFTSVITEILVDSSTISNNSVDVPTPDNSGNPGAPVLAGVLLGGKLNNQQNFNNVTVANNSINNPAPDNRNTISGFFGTFGKNSADLLITNATIVGNTSNQPASTGDFSAFAVFYLDLDFSNYPNIVINEVRNGAKSQNSLIAKNLNNNVSKNCLGNVNLSSLGFNVTIDGTPTNLGHNLTDDQTCNGYTYAPNLYNTIEHDVADNGGPVPTIKLLPGSPAIGAATAVLGISTDARGIARPTTPDVGAYQSVLGISTDIPNVAVPNTGFGRVGIKKNNNSTIITFVINTVLISSLLILIKKRENNA